MKRLSFALLLLVAGFSFVYAAGARGNGKIITIEKNLSPFERIHVGGSGELNYHQSQEYRVAVQIDSNLEEHLDISTRDSRLYIGPKQGRALFSPTKLIVDVYCPSPSGVAISGSVKFTTMDKISAGDFRLNISGSGKVDGDFECDNFSTRISGSCDINSNIVCTSFSAEISGSGKIAVTGSAKNLNVSISGSGEFNANEFQTNNASVNVSGSGLIQLWVMEYLQARMSGSGGIRYRGDPQIDLRSSGSARLEKYW